MKRANANPVVSICIANYNGDALLDECIHSIFEQEFQQSFEILVHDDASTDDSVRILRERYPDILVIESSENVGYCKSNNRMVEIARGKYVLLLNNDATLRKGALSALVDAAESTTGPFAFSVPQFDYFSGELVDKGVRLDLLHTPFANTLAHCEKLAYVQAACLLVSRDVWHSLGGFPDWMESNAEDSYFCALIRLMGGRVEVLEKSGYDHRQGTSFGGNRKTGKKLETTYRRRYLSERNRACLVAVCTPTPIAWLLYGVQLMCLLIEGTIVATLLFDSKVLSAIYWRAAVDSLRRMKPVLRARRTVQRTRKIGLSKYMCVLDPIPNKLRVLWTHGLPRLR